MNYALRSYTHACIGLTFEWFKEELPYTTEQFVQLQYNFMPVSLKEAYEA